jgi:hypothetical protein
MKKILILIICCILPLSVFAQANITTKRIKISDFPQKVTKVVLTGNVLFDAVLKEEITARWRVSPFEFCTLQEFENLKDKDQYYFLMSIKGQFRTENEPGLQFLTIIKGGPKAANGINEMLEVISVPVASAENPSGRELIFLPAFITILQQFTSEAIENDKCLYSGLSYYSRGINNSKEKNILLTEEDLDSLVNEDIRNLYINNGVEITDIDHADSLLKATAPNTLVSYVAEPAEAKDGFYCYKMLIDTQTYQLYFFRKHRISPKHGAGFTDYDLRSIHTTRTK